MLPIKEVDHESCERIHLETEIKFTMFVKSVASSMINVRDKNASAVYVAVKMRSRSPHLRKVTVSKSHDIVASACP